MAPVRTLQSAAYRHEALLYRSPEDYLARAVPFVSEALQEDLPVMVAVIESHWMPLREALGGDASRVHHVDMARLGHNPGRILPAWRDFVSEHAAVGRPLRGIGEPIWAGRRAAEISECQIHEAMLNEAFPPDTELWLLCPYDVTALGRAVLDEARRSHPCVSGVPAEVPTQPRVPRYAGPGHSRSLSARPLPEPTVHPRTMAFGRGDISAVRGLVHRQGLEAGLHPGRVDDLTLAVSELAANSVDHGGGHGRVRVWREPGALVVEVADDGRLGDPLAGRRTPAPSQERGRGVWIVNQLTDLLQLRSTPAGTVARVVTWLPAEPSDAGPSATR